MTYEFSPAIGRRSVTRESLLILALRIWRSARDAGLQAQPLLSGLLADFQSAILSPVLDALLRSYEQALGRPPEAGNGEDVSRDEHLLLSLFEGASISEWLLDGTEQRMTVLDHALVSTKIMIGLETADWHTRPMSPA